MKNTVSDISVIAKQLKVRRKQLKLTIESAASICGVSKQTYNDLELGKAAIKFETLLKIISAMGIKLFIEPVRDISASNDVWG